MRRRSILAAMTTLSLFCAALTACGQKTSDSAASSTPGSAAISGAGATFPAPIYSHWAEAYKGQSGVSLNYQPIGSGGGIKQIKAKTVDFGASDKPLKPDELAAAGLYQFPTVVGGVVPAINVPGIASGQLKLTGPLLADMFQGAVKAWNDPRIAALNPGLKLPALPITPVHRSDGSGTTFLFTTYLAGQSPVFAQKIGASDSVSWTSGLGGKGNDGVAAFVRQTAGSIGYVEYAYARQNNIALALIQNRAGQYPAPDASAFSAAAAGADWAHAPGNYLLLLNQPAANAWPITGATFILVYRQPADGARAASVLKFFDWAYSNGDAAAAKLAYVPLPAAVKALVRQQWSSEIKGADGKAIWAAK